MDLARNIAHIFIRDPLTLYENSVHQNEEDTGHFYVCTYLFLVSVSLSEGERVTNRLKQCKK